jgi:hypothetical protein
VTGTDRDLVWKKLARIEACVKELRTLEILASGKLPLY